MSGLNVLEINLHFTGEGCLVVVQRKVWKGFTPKRVIARQDYLEGYGHGTTPQAVLRHLADLYDRIPESPEQAPDPA